MDDTLIVFCSDHGEYLGDHHAGAKGFFHEQSAHVPMVVSLPRSWVERQHGTRVDEPVTLADLCPTFVEAAGGDVSGTDGQDLVALARGELDDPREYVVGLNNSGDECMWLGLTDGVWTYIWYPEGGVDQLFEVSADRLSEHDLSGVPAHAEQRESMRAELRERLERRDPQFVEDGDLIERPVQETAERDDRIGGPGSVHGFVTEHWDGPGPWH
jgi:arylsulfatase A-like enzyme